MLPSGCSSRKRPTSVFGLPLALGPGLKTSVYSVLLMAAILNRKSDVTDALGRGLTGHVISGLRQQHSGQSVRRVLTDCKISISTSVAVTHCSETQF